MKTTLLQFLSTFLVLLLFCSPVSYGTGFTVVQTPQDIPPTPQPIKGPAFVCAASDATYQVDPVAGATSYSWTVPAGWSIVAGQGTHTITVKPGAESGAIRVKAQNQYGESGSRQLEVTPTTTMPAQPQAITGPVSLCTGSKITYRVQQVSGAMSYVWWVPAGWIISSGQGTSQLEVTAGPGGGNISVAAENACGISQQTSLAVSVVPPVSNNTLDGNQTFCFGQVPAALVGTVPAGGDGTYTYQWESSTTSATANFAPAAGANNTQNYMPGPLSATSWFRRAVHSGACEASYSNVLKIEVTPAIADNYIAGNHELNGPGVPPALTGSTPSGGNKQYVYLWQASTQGPDKGFEAAPGDNASINYAPGKLTETTWFRRKVVSGCEVTSDVVKIEVRPVPDKPAIEQATEGELRANLEGDYYEWQRDEQLLPYHTRVIRIEKAGAYKVRVRYGENFFSPWSDVLNVTITGLAAEAKAMGVAILPNPSKGPVTITTRVPLHHVELQVVNLLGRVVLQKQLPQVEEALELGLGHLPNGVYLLLLHTPKGLMQQKILLQH